MSLTRDAHPLASRAVLVLLLLPPILFYLLMLLDEPTLAAVTREDGLIESLGAICFLACAVAFLACFGVRHSVFYLLFGLLFLFTFFEEISWGQRIIGFETPLFFQQYNMQHELNIHNLVWFHGTNAAGAAKGFVDRLINMDRLFSLFWFGFCVMLPLLARSSAFVLNLTARWRIPVVPVALAAMFLLNYITGKGLQVLSPALVAQITEIKETNFAYLFALFAAAEAIRVFAAGEGAAGAPLVPGSAGRASLPDHLNRSA
jgi:hypothetical protein